jgi:glycosyltransferase involved in cell wall biosynthesis
MKIVYFTSIYYPYIGGLQKSIHDLAENIRMKGYDVKIITGDTKINHIEFDLIDNIGVYRVPIKATRFGLPILKNNSDIKIIKNLIKKVDIIHNHDIKFLPLFHLFYYLTKKNKIKYFLSSHGFIFHTNYYLLFKKFYMILFSFLFNIYNAIFCVSKQDLKIAKKYKLHNIFYVPVSVDMKKFTDVDNRRIKEGRLLYYGRISQNKGIENVLKKFLLLPNDFLLTIVGSGDIAYMKKIISIYYDTMNIDKKTQVTFTGEVSDAILIKYFEEAEFIILPSIYEGFGLTLIESLSANKKVIAHINESYRDILSSLNLDHYLFDFSDASSSLLNKIIELRKLQTKTINLDRYTLNTMTTTICRFYQGLNE